MVKHLTALRTVTSNLIGWLKKPSGWLKKTKGFEWLGINGWGLTSAANHIPNHRKLFGFFNKPVNQLNCWLRFRNCYTTDVFFKLLGNYWITKLKKKKSPLLFHNTFGLTLPWIYPWKYHSFHDLYWFFHLEIEDFAQKYQIRVLFLGAITNLKVFRKIRIRKFMAPYLMGRNA